MLKRAGQKNHSAYFLCIKQCNLTLGHRIILESFLNEIIMSVCAIIASYKRPQNLQRIVAELKNTPEISRIIISQNNIEVDVRTWIDVEQHSIEVVSYPTSMPSNTRFAIAAEQPEEYFFCPDDDLFLTHTQISYLIGELKKRPDRVHGMYGQYLAKENDQLTLKSGAYGINSEIDIVNRAYAFSRKHAQSMEEVAQFLGYKHLNEARFLDDILLSFSGLEKPICHDIGEFADCPTSHEPGIAMYTQDHFEIIRTRAFARLAKRRNLIRQQQMNTPPL